jgi:hypothetical protein
MKALHWYGASLLSLALLGACEKKTEPAPSAATEPPPAAAPAPTAEKPIAAATVDLSKVPVEEQFEQEVEQEVTPTNFETQLDTLEKELKAE